MPKFVRISCKCPDLKERKGRSNFLGAFQIDVVNTAFHHCKCCNTTWKHTVDEHSVVTRSKQKTEIEFSDEIIIVDVGR